MYSQQSPVAMQNCIEICWKCRHECQSALYNYCLIEGGKHASEMHVKLMTDCIQICQLAADAMVRQSAMHAEINAACAAICEACVLSCEALEGTEMQICAQICRKCAQLCREMGEIKNAAQAVHSSDATGIMA